jgi:hypothetical protein
MATNSNFNLSKTTKRIAASIKNPADRRAYTKMMITAESAYANAKNRKFSDPASSQKGPNKPQSDAS